MVNCPDCGEEYVDLGNHWQHSPKHRPKLTQKQIDVVTGLLMGDGWISNNSKNSSIFVEMISPNYLQYLDNLFGCLGNGFDLINTAAESAQHAKDNGFSPRAKTENYSDVYRWRTRSHPEFNSFNHWYSTGEKVWPEDIELTPTVLKHWYVGDGSYRTSNRSDCISISMCNEVNNESKITKYFVNSKLPTPCNYSTYDRGHRKNFSAQWTVEDSYKLWDYMGEPLPDFEYKWPKEYRQS